MSPIRGAIVLLHGVASNRTRWSEFIAATALRGMWALLAPDLRGHGEFVDRGRVDIDAWCRDIAALLDAQGHPRAILAGHCLGANIALHFAARFPQRVLGLVLIEPLPPGALSGTMRWLRRMRFVVRIAVPLVRALNALGLYRRHLAPLDLAVLDRDTRAALARGPEGEAQLARYASPALDLRTTATAAYLQSLLAATEPLPAPERIDAPVLALLAGHSTFTALRQTTAWLSRLADCESVTLPAKHWIPTEQPDALRAAIEAWVARRFGGDA